MSPFEFFMAFYGLLLGLGFAELMNGFASLLRERTPPKLGLRTPLMALLIFAEMLANFIDAWKRLQTIEISFLSLLTPTLIGLFYFTVAVILVPRDLQDWPSLDDYFDRRKRWVAGLLIAVNLLINALYPTTMAHILTGQLGSEEIIFLLLNAWLLGFYVLLFFARSRRVQIAAIAANIVFYPVSYSGVFGGAAPADLTTPPLHAPAPVPASGS